ncbi:sulfatase-like hydrolase/transferase [Akkermansiaceae bacterium]|nr:sulfatase-like hydrolase/transferase [Akkermansiaceae bacterium]
MKHLSKFLFAPRLLCLSALTILAFTSNAADKPNILFIAIDDLRPELGCYGSEAVLSPNLNQLASKGLRFDRAYCQEAICSPSRASLLSGLRPDQTGITHNYVQFRDLNPDVITLPQHFMAHGYETVSSGKIFHRPGDDPQSWSRMPAVKKTPYKKPKYTFADPKNHELHMQQKKGNVRKVWGGLETWSRKRSCLRKLRRAGPCLHRRMEYRSRHRNAQGHGGHE